MTEGVIVPAKERDEYFPVIYVESLEKNAPAHGFDVGSEPRRRAALEQAWTTGLPTATIPIRLAQETGSQQGFIVFFPLYHGPAGTVGGRRESLQGFATAERDRYVEAGCDDFVAKPFRTGRIYGCLNQLPGVSFVHEPLAESSNEQPIDLHQLTLPEDLAARLAVAAELHSATVLKSCLAEMEQLGPAGERVAGHLRSFLSSSDPRIFLIFPVGNEGSEDRVFQMHES